MTTHKEPQIIIAGVIYGHVASKYIFVRLFRGTRHLNSKGAIATGSWIGIVLTCWLIAWIIAESIPVFNDLLSLISALFASCKSSVASLSTCQKLMNLKQGSPTASAASSGSS